MSASAEQDDAISLLNAPIHEKPIRFDVAFFAARKVSFQWMVVVALREDFSLCKDIYDFIELANAVSS